MLRRHSLAAFAAAVLSSLGCSKDEASPPAPPGVIAAPSSVLADGISSTVLTVTSGAAPFSLSTSRGTFQNGSTSVQVSAVGGFAVLSPCDARVTPSCAGPAIVSAVGADGGYVQIVVQFQGFEICDNGIDDDSNGDADCADAQCPLDSPCGPNGLLCSPTQQCNKCTGNGGAAEPSREVSCADGFDNDCDGTIDCLDSDCEDGACINPAGAAGVCRGGACVCAITEPAESTCGDGRDNDCDNLVDCQDPDCVGDTCNALRGLVCPGPAPSTCGVCPTGQTAEASAQCGDGKDNDCDGAVDCHDTDCQPAGAAPGAPCNAFGGVCALPNGVPTCGCPSGNTAEAACSGGVDDDCDGLTDCADPDCQPAGSGLAGPACDPFGRTCTSSGACACPGAGVEVCNNYDAGGAPIDADCDGRANCLDRDCRPAAPGEAGEDCSGADQFGMACDATGTCACTGNGGTPEAAEITCDDGLDNDCDFLVDCQDPDCGGATPRPCGPAGAVCHATLPSCICPGGTTESSCSDGIDNDCDGKTDCEEPSCAAVACSTAFPAYLCISGVCSDPATQYGVAVTPARARIPADGRASTAVDVAVTFKGAPRPGVSVSLALSNPALGALAPAAPVTTDAQGRASVTFTSAGPVGVVTITATVVGIGASGAATVEMPAVGEIRLANDGVLYPVMGVRSSGFQEQNQLVVELLDTAQRPYPDGLEVIFEHRPLGGSTLLDPVAAPACAVTPCVQSLAASEAGGLARARLRSGTLAGVVRVSATAVAGGIAHVFELPGIAIVGAKPNAGHFSVVCGPENVPAYAGTTCHVSTIDAPFTCVALLKDRYNNVLGRSTTVSFMSEAGAVGPPAVTPEYDPAAPPTDQGDLGTAVGLVQTLGGKLPKDVLAAPGEAFIATAPDACGVSQRSPRDGVVTVVAWTPGEEAYFDANGNGTYDFGEPFVDLPEPFVDYDDDDTRDGDEPFVDSDGDGTWDDVNGVWDTSSNVWTKTVVVYSGMPGFLRSGGLDHESRWMTVAGFASYPAPTPVATFAVRPAFPAEPFTDCNSNQIRDVAIAEPFTDQNGNLAYDPGEPFTDCNNSGAWEAVAAEPFSDLDGDGAFDAFPSPATSEGFVVSASDRNLNRLTAEARYAVAKPEGTDFEVTYFGRGALPDRRGLGFGFQPCLAANPASCALDCADLSAPPDVRCVMRTRVGDFSYGYTAGVTISGGSVGGFDGATQAFWDVTLFDESLRIAITGTHQ